MSTVYLSPLAGLGLVQALTGLGRRLSFTTPAKTLDKAVAAHPDMLMCALGVGPEAPLVFADPEALGPDYPGDAAFNALCLDRYFVHRLDITDPKLLRAAQDAGLRPVFVRQGYCKCACAVVDGRSVITADRGVASALSALGDVEVLTVRPGFVKLAGYPQGFLGGASGRVGDELWFNGDLSAHPDFAAIRDFIASRSLGLRYFPGYELEDIGSIIETK